jgi:hypothetical protein
MFIIFQGEGWGRRDEAEAEAEVEVEERIIAR